MVLQEQTLQFLGQKATQDLNPSNPYKVAPVMVRTSTSVLHHNLTAVTMPDVLTTLLSM